MGPAGTVCGWSCDSCDPSTSGHTGGTAGKEQVGLREESKHTVTEEVVGDVQGLPVRPRGPPDLSWPWGAAGWVPTHTQRGDLHSDKDPSSTEDLEKGYNPLRPSYSLHLSLGRSQRAVVPVALSPKGKQFNQGRKHGRTGWMSIWLGSSACRGICNALLFPFLTVSTKTAASNYWTIRSFPFQENPIVTASCTPWEMVTTWAESQITLGLIMPRSTHVPERYLEEQTITLSQDLRKLECKVSLLSHN